jgi:hypothetical protein
MQNKRGGEGEVVVRWWPWVEVISTTGGWGIMFLLVRKTTEGKKGERGRRVTSQGRKKVGQANWARAGPLRGKKRRPGGERGLVRVEGSFLLSFLESVLQIDFEPI